MFISLILTSDLNFTVDIKIEKWKEVPTIKQFLKNHKIDFMIIAGDSTYTGANGELVCEDGHIYRQENQISSFKKGYLHQFPNIPIYISLGIHDVYSESIRTKITRFFTGKWPENTIQGLIIEKHGELNYTFEKEGILFICLGNPSLEYLKNVLLNSTPGPIVIIFHFWTEINHNDFYQVIKNHQIIGILTGRTNVEEWRGIRIFSGTRSPIYITISTTTGQIEYSYL